MANELNVDVLAVMDAAIDRVARPHEAGLHAARAAVAELIEADKEYDRASRAWDDGRFTDWEGISNESQQKICADFENAIMRRHDALARVQGGSNG